MKNYKKLLFTFIGFLYFPVYLCAFVLHMVFRFALAITHLLLLEKRMAIDIINSLFGTKYGTTKRTIRK